MSRATMADLAASIPQATITRATQSVAQEILDRSEAEIDSILGGRYTLPLVAPYPADLIGAGCDVAAFGIQKRIGFNPEDKGGQRIKEAHDAALTWADDVAHGRKHPPIVDSSNGTIGVVPMIVNEKRKRGW